MKMRVLTAISWINSKNTFKYSSITKPVTCVPENPSTDIFVVTNHKISKETALLLVLTDRYIVKTIATHSDVPIKLPLIRRNYTINSDQNSKFVCLDYLQPDYCEIRYRLSKPNDRIKSYLAVWEEFKTLDAQKLPPYTKMQSPRFRCVI